MDRHYNHFPNHHHPPLNFVKPVNSDALALALSLISNVTNNSINYRPMSPLMTLNSHYNQIFDLVMFGALASMI